MFACLFVLQCVIVSLSHALPMFVYMDLEFSSQSNWIVETAQENGDIVWGDASSCPTGDIGGNGPSCLKLGAETLVSRSIPTTGFHGVSVEVGVNEVGLSTDGTEWCYMKYKTSSTDWVTENLIDGNGGSDGQHAHFDIPDNANYNNQSSFQLAIGNSGVSIGDDWCRWDFFVVWGTPYTRNPTAAPSNNPSQNPTKTPTMIPTNVPSKVPTIHPTQNPTHNPTAPPTSDTHDPSLMPSSNPTKAPSVSPTIYPSRNPTEYPTIVPSLHPSAPPSAAALTMFPSNHPSFIPSVKASIADTSADAIYNSPARKSPPHETILIVGVSSVGSCVLCVAIIFCYCKCVENKTNIKISRDHQPQKAEPVNVQNATDVDSSDAIAVMMANHMNRNSINNITVLTQEEKEVKQWLKDTVQLPEYAHLFLRNGYHSMEMIGDISMREELEAIGITLKGHQVRIMRQIKVIKQLQNAQEVALNKRGEEEDESDPGPQPEGGVIIPACGQRKGREEMAKVNDRGEDEFVVDGSSEEDNVVETDIGDGQFTQGYIARE